MSPRKSMTTREVVRSMAAIPDPSVDTTTIDTLLRGIDSLDADIAHHATEVERLKGIRQHLRDRLNGKVAKPKARRAPRRRGLPSAEDLGQQMAGARQTGTFLGDEEADAAAEEGARMEEQLEELAEATAEAPEEDAAPRRSRRPRARKGK